MTPAGHPRSSAGSGAGAPLACVVPAIALAACAHLGDRLVDIRVRGDAISEPLVATAPDPDRGRAVIMGREGNCLLCHAVPETGARFMGNLGPALSGIGARLSAAQLRLRLVDPMRLNPDTIMPSYYRVDGLERVAQSFRGKPILTEQQIEDTIAYLRTLR